MEAQGLCGLYIYVILSFPFYQTQGGHNHTNVSFQVSRGGNNLSGEKKFEWWKRKLFWVEKSKLPGGKT